MLRNKVTEMNEQRELAMFGMTTADIREDYMESITARCSGLEMVVMGILSDVQHMTEHDMSKESIRKQLNVAKFILSEMMDQKERA
jgi:hypothetical protein